MPRHGRPLPPFLQRHHPRDHRKRLSGQIPARFQIPSFLRRPPAISPPHLSTAPQLHARILKSGLQRRRRLSSSLFHLYLSGDLPHNAFSLFEETASLNTHPFHGNLLIMKFLRKNEIDNSYKVFKKMHVRDRISWNSMITAAVRSSRPNEALLLHRRMILAGVEPDCFSFSAVLSACARVGAIRHGAAVHRLIEEKDSGYQSNPILNSALIDMYSKCRRIDLARKIFYSAKKFSRSISIWNSMITGFAVHGLAGDALQVFDEMTAAEGIWPDGVTFVGILTACGRSGMVREARFYFESMQRDFHVRARLEHYGAMIDGLARAGELEDALRMINGMRIEPDAAVWRSLLGACRRHGRYDVAEAAVGRMSRLSSGDYVLLSNMYSSAERWKQAEGVWKAMMERGVRKGRGFSWVELGGRVYRFKAADRSHYDSGDIHRALGELMRGAREAGYVPATETSTRDVSEEEKEEALSCHSEKLAVAFCVMKKGRHGIGDIRVSKNLQTCRDCHEWMKAVSLVLRRAIVVRDRIRFHRFEGGACSCRDYW